MLIDGQQRITAIMAANLETSSVNSPAFNTFLAAQIHLICSSLFIRGTMISDLLDISGDVHHIFPKAYLRRQGIDTKGRYNQVAKYTYLDTQVNKAIGDEAPCIYFGKVLEQCASGCAVIGNVTDRDALKRNLEENAIPESVVGMEAGDYDRFLEKRRRRMARLIEGYYKRL